MENTGIRFAEVNLTGKTPRTRRRHVKSRLGCESCKRQRIKCDEKTPKCGSCIRKGLDCYRDDHASPSSVKAPQASGVEQTPPADHESGQDDRTTLTPPPDPEINMLHMQLFFHFESDTRFTLVFGSDVWKQCMGLAMKVNLDLAGLMFVSHLSRMNICCMPYS